MERTMKVTGKGKISVKPDTVRIIITQSDIIQVYEDAISESAEKKNALSRSLAELGFEKDALKTLHYDVNTEYESRQDESGYWKQRFAGYRYTHRMKLEFPSDSDRLGKVLAAAAACPGQPEFSIQYTISDPEAAKNELLFKAVEDSKVKASVLSKAAGVELKEIISIDYSWGEIDLVTKPVSLMMARDCNGAASKRESSAGLDIEAEDIDVTDTVTVVWSIG